MIVLDAYLLNTGIYGKDQGESGSIQGKEERPYLHLSVVANEKGAFESPLNTSSSFNTLLTLLGYLMLMPFS